MTVVKKKSILDNGMVLVTESLSRFQSLAVGVWVKAGTRHEASEHAGLSHFLEHMMFKGTSNRSSLEIAQAIDEVGGDFNAFTAREYTCFHLLLLSKNLKLAVEILADVLLNSKFDPDELERERKVILQEILMVEDNPEELVHDLFLEKAFGDHPLGKNILGTQESVSSFDRETVYDYFKQHYTPSQMIIAVSGDVSHERVRFLLNNAFKKAKQSSPKKILKKNGMRKPKICSGSNVLGKTVEQAHLVVGFPGVTYQNPQRFAAFILNNFLGGGMSSSLFQEIREKRGLAYSIYSSLMPFSDSGLFSIYVGTSPKEIQTCLKIMGKELERLREKPLRKRELEIVKNNLKGTILLNSDSVENRMSAIAKSEMFFGNFFSAKQMCKDIDRVTEADVQRLAKNFFNPKKAIVMVMGPVKKQEFRKFLA